MNIDEHYINLDNVNNLKNLFKCEKSNFESNNKKYYNLNYDNKTLFVNFKANLYNFKVIPRKKIYLQVDDDTLSNFKKLIRIVSTNIGINIEEYDSIFEGNNLYLLAFISGLTRNNKHVIFTKINKLINKKLEQLKVDNNSVNYNNNYIENFKAIITLKIKTICEDNYNNVTKYKLFNDIHQVTILEEIKNDANNNLELILKLANN